MLASQFRPCPLRRSPLRRPPAVTPAPLPTPLLSPGVTCPLLADVFSRCFLCFVALLLPLPRPSDRLSLDGTPCLLSPAADPSCPLVSLFSQSCPCPGPPRIIQSAACPASIPVMARALSPPSLLPPPASRCFGRDPQVFTPLWLFFFTALILAAPSLACAPSGAPFLRRPLVPPHLPLPLTAVAASLAGAALLSW